MRPLVFSILICIWMIGPAVSAPKSDLWEKWLPAAETTTPGVYPDTSVWQTFLERYRSVGADGVARVRYSKVTPNDRAALSAWVDAQQSVPVAQLTRDEQLAYWLNLYNAMTVRLILDHHPVTSIRDIKFGFFSFGPWDEPLLKIDGEAVSLDDIEHRILRPIWQDPRIHYVVNCASVGCPDLPAKPISPLNWDEQMTKAAKNFVQHPRAVTVEGDRVTVSKIYQWFEEDFGGSPEAVINHIHDYADPNLTAALFKTTQITDYTYDWSLNDHRIKD